MKRGTIKIPNSGNFQKRLWIHFLFWILSFYILLKIFVGNGEISSIDIIYTILFQLTMAPIVYFNLFWLKPNFLKEGKWIYYLLLIPVLLFLGIELNYIFFNKVIDLILPGYYFISYYDKLQIGQFLFGHLIILMLLQFSIERFELNAEQKRVATLESEKVKYEMKALLSQINPHFLFNTLNSLYSMILSKNDDAGEYVLKLSEVLRYVIYHSKRENITLVEEIELIKNYIFLQQLRTDYPNAEVTIMGENENWKIAPMLILPLLENAFKHGERAFEKNSKIEVVIDVGDKSIKFDLRNKVDSSHASPEEVFKGIGIENVKRRLEILYPEKHEFKTLNDGENFEVSLTIWNP